MKKMTIPSLRRVHNLVEKMDNSTIKDVGRGLVDTGQTGRGFHSVGGKGYILGRESGKISQRKLWVS